MKAIIEEDSFRDHEEFPGMLEKLAILMLLRRHRVIENRYEESEAVALSSIF